MSELHYRVIDVFTQVPLEGNALAVFPEAGDLDAHEMQKIARELNLSETTFVFPAQREDCIARVRIFTPARELPFAGHPTIGTSCVLRETGIVPQHSVNFALEEDIGPVGVRIENTRAGVLIWLRTPPITKGKTYPRDAYARALGLREEDVIDGTPCEVFTAGNPNCFIAVRDQDAVDRASADPSALHALFGGEQQQVCAFIFTPTPQGAYARMFAPELGVVEDPATGSATGPLAAFMMEHGLAGHADGTRFISEQGVKMGRRSLLHVFVHGEHGTDGIEVGGYVTPLTRATMTLSRGD